MAYLSNSGGVGGGLPSGAVIFWHKDLTGVPTLDTTEFEEASGGTFGSGPLSGETKANYNGSQQILRCNGNSENTLTFDSGAGTAHTFFHLNHVITVKN